ncbi:lyase family protein [Salinispira pacifica]|uniref:Adenylosuccinate lyase n=1 Tax=Salinispira pacifica TaxID=1307761 RepID=V5WJ76_9SPIO|nr:lyase family protein [Salinispira pacifica]AHC15221.1 Adenylosuccinate lyase [Salinispira pacifica]
MEQHSIFENISPLDHRYYQSNRELFDLLRKYISEEASVLYCAKVEAALVKSHLHFQDRLSDELVNALDQAVEKTEPALVYEEEAKTQHNIRALVNVMKQFVPEEIRHFVHMGATSVDILDTANALKLREAVRRVILPQLIQLEEQLIRFATEHAETPQVGRTHGQYAVPITLGHSFAEYVSRLGKSIQEIDRRSLDLRGKLAGAVGGYNATSMIYEDPVEFERHSLSLLGLKPSDHSTQMVEPEHVLRLFLEINTAFGIIANLADDLRHLQRSEIDEVREYFSPTQVGSSTMPQKRNPWNCEHVKSLWKAFSPRIMSLYMDQISEHQRDLSNSASGRFTVEILAGFAAAVKRMVKILSGMTVNMKGLQRNLENAGSSVLAEPAYILLSSQGEADAHEIIRKFTLKAEQEEKSLSEVMKSDKAVWEKISRRLEAVGVDNPDEFFSNPQLYRGRTAQRARDLGSFWSREMNALSTGLKNEE